jgi:outer membrane murein-binding lipoprotein Lpp
MTDEPENLTLKQLAVLRKEMQEGFTLINSKIGTLAESMVTMRKQITELQTDVHALRSDVQMIAVAVDQHTTRLDRIESLLPHHNA